MPIITLPDGTQKAFEQPVTVAEVAGRWGFWHMGQMAADYRKLFDELPSQTLRGS